jgi:hypothetical protein
MIANSSSPYDFIMLDADHDNRNLEMAVQAIQLRPLG